MSNFYFVNKDIEAQRGKGKLSEIAAGGDRSVGASILLRVGGWIQCGSCWEAPQVCLRGCSIPRHFKCASRRGIWHLNFP